MSLQGRTFLERFVLQPVLRAWQALAVLPVVWRIRFRSLRQYVRGLPLAVRKLLLTVSVLAICVSVTSVAVLAFTLHYIYFDRSNLPDIEPFAGFEFSAIGHVYDLNGQPLAELARERRHITQYQEIPPVVCDAILAAEDKNFFSHNGVDYSALPRVMGKIGFRRTIRPGRDDKAGSPIVFRQGGSTITQQIVRGYFLRNFGNKEVRRGVLSYVIGARNEKKLERKVEEMRLSLWVEEEMARRFGSKRRAKEEILARYASFIYMGNGQYGFATAAERYFGRPLSRFTADDAGKAAVLAGIPKSPTAYVPSAANEARILRRRNQILELMKKHGALSRDAARAAEQRPIEWVKARPNVKQENAHAPAVLDSALDEIQSRYWKVTVEDLYQGRIQVYTTTDSRIQRIAGDALEHGLAAYEKRHPQAAGIIQGSVVVLKNSDAGILAEVGGRKFYNQRITAFSDFNRVTRSLRQPGSVMKPIVYLAAFQHGAFDLETIVPDEPIYVADTDKLTVKAISNYDGEFKGMIPLREALAESRNAVAIWITQQVGIGSILQTARSLGIKTPLRPYVATALGASEMTLLELANAYRTIASGTRANPHIIRKIVRDSGDAVADSSEVQPVSMDDDALLLIQEGLRGVVRIPTGTAHSLDSSGFPIPVMGKTGTTNNFRDALFIGSTFGPDGITIAVRIGFDDNQSLGPKETGARAALPVFREIMLGVYREKIIGPPPAFPPDMEQRISAYLERGWSDVTVAQQSPPTPLSPQPLNPLLIDFSDLDKQTWWRVADGVEKPPR